MDVNHALFMAIHGTAASPPALIVAAQIMAQWPLLLALGLTGGQLWRHRESTAAWRLLGAWIIACGLEALISHVAPHPRPFAAGFGPALLAHSANNSMPSTHATVCLLLLLTLALGRHFRSCVAVAALTLMVAWARVYLGLHWPADMLGSLLSAVISMALAGAILVLATRTLRRRPHVAAMDAAVPAVGLSDSPLAKVPARPHPL